MWSISKSQNVTSYLSTASILSTYCFISHNVTLWLIMRTRTIATLFLIIVTLYLSYFKLYPVISWKCFHQPQRQYSPLRGSWWAGHHLDPTCWGPTCLAGPFPAGERGAVHSGRQGGTGDGTFRTQTRASVPACVRGGWGGVMGGML